MICITWQPLAVGLSLTDAQRSTGLLVACVLRRMFSIVLPTNESQKRSSFWAAAYLLFIALGAGAVSLGALACISLHREVPAVGSCASLPCSFLPPREREASVHSWARHLPFLERERK